MISPFKKIARRIETFDRVQRDRILMKYLKGLEAEIIDLNREQLKERGETSEGTKIASYQPYAPSTVSKKRSKGQPTDMVTLYDEGDFQGAFEVRFGNDWFAIFSNDYKAPFLEPKYGDEIYGLTEESKRYLLSLFRDDFVTEFKNYLLR